MGVLITLLFLITPGAFFIFIATAPKRNHRKEMQFWLDRKIQEYDLQLKKKKISKANLKTYSNKKLVMAARHSRNPKWNR